VAKAGVLGDVVDGSPIKGPDAGGGYDRLPAGSPGQADYATFRSKDTTTLDNMRNSIFLTANDGMLHVFDASTGKERFAYVPNSVYSVPNSVGGATEQKLKMLSDPGYAHRFLVDGPPRSPTPSSARLRPGPMAHVAAGQHRRRLALRLRDGRDRHRRRRTASSTRPISCGSSRRPARRTWATCCRTPCGAHARRFVGGPLRQRLRQLERQAKLYILDLATGKVLKEIAVGSSGSGNGLSQPNFTVDINRQVTAIYAGDLKGNLWKFDVDSDDPKNWTVAFGGEPLFKNTDKQPITVMPELTVHPSGGWMVTFGTGKMFETEDTTTMSVNVNLNKQAIYGIWDRPNETKGLADTSLLFEETDNALLPAAGDTSVTGTTTDRVDYATKPGGSSRCKARANASR
jgi:type IV pilus assembly protein PilY1